MPLLASIYYSQFTRGSTQHGGTPSPRSLALCEGSGEAGNGGTGSSVALAITFQNARIAGRVALGASSVNVARKPAPLSLTCRYAFMSARFDALFPSLDGWWKTTV